MDLLPNTPQFFFDDIGIVNQRRVVRRWLPAQVYPRPALEPEMPWEARFLTLYGSVLADPAGGWRMYYTDWAPGHGHPHVLLATSADGFRWRRPELGVVEWQGSRANNIVLTPDANMDAPSVIYDPVDAVYPYKLLAFQHGDMNVAWGPGWGLWLYRSRDGLAWEQVPVVRLRAGDMTNLMATRVHGRHVAYTRHPEMMARAGCRAIYRSESADGLMSWSEPELVLARDLQDEPDVEFYGMSVFERHGWHIGLLQYWRSDVDVIEVHLAFSRDGRRWMRPEPRAPFIAATYDWNRAWTTCASGGPICVGEQMVFYFGGRWSSHSYDSAQQYGAIGYASLALDRFCAIEGAAGGTFDTAPLAWPGGDLTINADTRESFASHPMHLSGEIGVEVLDGEGRELAEWSGERKAVFRGNTHSRARIHDQRVVWPEGRSLAALKGQVVRLRFHLRHARLFTFEARVGV
jgi:hypothetical protein